MTMQTLLAGLVLVLSLIVQPVALALPAGQPAAAPALQAAGDYALKYSKAANRANPLDLNGQTVAGKIYVFVLPESGATKVDFYVDNPAATGAPVWTEGNPPWDFPGGNSAGGNGYDTTKLSDGPHSITAAITLSSGGKSVVTANFTVANSAPPPTATQPPATVAPTATQPPATVAPTATQPPATAAPTATQPPATAAPATPTPVPALQGSYNNLVSKSSNRSNAVNLNGQTVSGNIYVFTSPESGATKVDFYLDNPNATGAPFHSEGNPPWDFNGGNATTATAYDTRKLSDGSHSITAAVTLSSGGKTLVTSTFTVKNTSPTATQPPATATAAPTTPPNTSGSIYWGVNMQGMPSDMTKLSNWERDVTGKGVSIVHWGHNWANGSSYRTWSTSSANNVRNHGSIPMISWNPDGGDDSKYQLADIIGGAHDAYIRQFATDAKNWGKPLFVRMMHEMNGSWGYPWQELSNGNSKGQFVQAWRHIVDVMRGAGANNIAYVWCPNFIFPSTTWPSFASLYPGDGYVDWTCLDGYNWGTHRQEGWMTFDQIYNYSYNEILKVAPSKPMMVGEFGSVEQGGSKANWFTETLGSALPSRFPKMRAIVYFNWSMDGVDWRIESSAAASSAWKNGIASKYYAANTFGGLSGGKPPAP